MEYINKAVAEHPNVMFGSYPYVSNSTQMCLISIDARSEEEADEALKTFKRLIPYLPCNATTSPTERGG